MGRSQGHRDAAGFEHSFQKWCVEYWGEGNGYYVEKEAKGEFSKNKKIPDVVLRLKKPDPDKNNPIYVEVQRNIYKDNWYEKTTKIYGRRCLLIIRVENFEKLTRRVVKRLIGKLLEAKADRHKSQEKETPYKPRKAASDNTHYMEYRGHHIKNTYQSKRRIDIIEERKKDGLSGK